MTALLRLIVERAVVDDRSVPSVPIVPPAPTCSVPAAIVVPPAIGVGAGEIVVPVPICASAPVPLRTLAIVTVSLRLIARTPLLTSAPVPSRPVVPPLPTCKVPGADRRGPAVGIVAGQDRRPRPRLCQRAGSADDSADESRRPSD